MESQDILLDTTAVWFPCWPRSLRQVDPQQLSKHSGALCSSRPPQGLLEERKAATLWNLRERLLRMRWSWGVRSLLWTECQGVEIPRWARSHSHRPLRSDKVWGPLLACVRQPTALGAKSQRTASPPSHGPPTVVLAQIGSCYISFLHCHVEKCDGAWKIVLQAK